MSTQQEHYIGTVFDKRVRKILGVLIAASLATAGVRSCSAVRQVEHLTTDKQLLIQELGDVEASHHSTEAARASLDAKLKVSHTQLLEQQTSADQLTVEFNKALQDRENIRAKFASVMALNDGLKVELEGLKSKNQALAQTITENDQKVTHAAELVDQKDAADKLTAEYNQALQTSENMRAKLVSMSAINDGLKIDIENLQVKNQELAQVIDANSEIVAKAPAWQEQIASLTGEKQQLLSQANLLPQLQQQLTEQKASLEQGYAEQIGLLQGELSDVKLGRQQLLDETVPALEAQIVGLEEEQAKLVAETTQASEAANVNLSALNTELDSTKITLTETQTQLDGLIALRDEITAANQTLQAEFDENKSTVETQSIQLASRKEQIDALTIERDQLLEARDRLKSEIEVAQTQAQETAGRLTNAEDQIQALSVYKVQAAEFSQWASEKTSLQTALNAATAERDDVRSSLEAEMQKLTVDLVAARESDVSQEAVMNDLRSRNDELSTEIEALTSKLQDTTAVDALNANITQLSSERDELIASNEGLSLKLQQIEFDAANNDISTALETQVNSLTGERDTLKSQVMTLEGDLAESLKVKAALDIELDALKADRDSLKTDFDSVSVKLNAQNDSLAAALAEKASFAAMLSTNESEGGEKLTQLQTKIETLLAEKDALLAEKGTLSTQVSTITSQLDEAQKSALTASADKGQLSSLQQALESEKSQVQTLGQEKQVLVDQINELSQQLEQSKSLATDLDLNKASLEEQKNIVVSLTAEKEQVDVKLQDLMSQLEGAEAALVDKESLQQQLTLLTEEKTVLEGTLSSLKSSVDEKDSAIKQLESSLVEAQSANTEATNTRNTVISGLSASLDSLKVNGLDVREERGGVIIELSNTSLYSPGSAYLTSAGSRLLGRIGRLLEAYPDYDLQVEGHTDNIPVGAVLAKVYPSNWELSIARATQAVKALNEKGGIAPTRLSAAGYADTKPVTSNETAAGRAANRRVAIRLSPSE